MPAGEIRMQVRGAGEFAALASRLRGAANREVRLELLRGIRKAAAPVPAAARSSALATLPRSGGLAELVAATKFGTRTRLSGAAVGIRVIGASTRHLVTMDMGSVRHPVHGNKKVWVDQDVQPGWWTTPTTETGAEARPEIEAVIQRVKRKIEG